MRSPEPTHPTPKMSWPNCRNEDVMEMTRSVLTVIRLSANFPRRIPASIPAEIRSQSPRGSQRLSPDGRRKEWRVSCPEFVERLAMSP